MEEQYELISKQTLLELREENKKLKEQLKNEKQLTTTDKNEFQKQFLIDIKEMLEQKHEEEKKELFNELREIKEINKSTLDNVLQKTQNLDIRLEDMIETLQGLVSTMTELIDHNNEEKEDDLFKEEPIQSSEIFENEIAKITIKLEDIETFMKNLRVLLSYLEPSRVTLNKPPIPNMDSQGTEKSSQPPKLNLN
ncbi:MAG: hypothetical protein VXZ40_05125 [Nanoarchaeota archaeon]|nr:hypothetical protein [Nanoarchaeota archaeon]